MSASNRGEDRVGSLETSTPNRPMLQRPPRPENRVAPALLLSRVAVHRTLLMVWVAALVCTVVGVAGGQTADSDAPKPWCYSQAVPEEDKALARGLAANCERLLAKGRHGSAYRVCSMAESICHAPIHLLNMARAEKRGGNVKEAKKVYETLIREHLPKDAPRGFQQHFQQQKKEAEKELKSLQEIGDGTMMSVSRRPRMISAVDLSALRHRGLPEPFGLPQVRTCTDNELRKYTVNTRIDVIAVFAISATGIVTGLSVISMVTILGVTSSEAPTSFTSCLKTELGRLSVRRRDTVAPTLLKVSYVAGKKSDGSIFCDGGDVHEAR